MIFSVDISEYIWVKHTKRNILEFFFLNFCYISSGYFRVHLGERHNRNILEFFLIFVTFPVAILKYIWVKQTNRNVLEFFEFLWHFRSTFGWNTQIEFFVTFLVAKVLNLKVLIASRIQFYFSWFFVTFPVAIFTIVLCNK